MLKVVRGDGAVDLSGAMGHMFEDRKRVFVDLLNWDVPIVDDRYEIDQFDGPDAVYMLVTDPDQRRHLGSVRLLPSTAPHILGDIFPQLCAGAPPRGAGVFEITRLCLSPSLGSLRQGMAVRRQLAVALAEYALRHDIERYTLVCDAAHVPQLLAVGWDCEPLGLPRAIGGQMLCAMGIAIDARTLATLRAAGAPRRRVLREKMDEALPLAA